MKLIKITNGTYGHRPGGSEFTKTKTANDEPFEVADAEAERLVAMKVAAYAEPVEAENHTDEDVCARFAESLSSYIDSADDVSAAIISAFELLAQAAADAGVELPVESVATPEGGENGEGEGVNSSEQENGAEGAENNEQPDNEDSDVDIPAYNAEMSVAALKEIFRDCGLTYKVSMSRADMVAALDEYFADDDDGESPPDLGTEEPVT